MKAKSERGFKVLHEGSTRVLGLGGEGGKRFSVEEGGDGVQASKRVGAARLLSLHLLGDGFADLVVGGHRV